MATGKNNRQVVTGPTLAASMPQGDIGGMEIRRGEKRPAYNDRKVMKVNVRSRSLGVENKSIDIKLRKGYQPQATVEYHPRTHRVYSLPLLIPSISEVLYELHCWSESVLASATSS